MNCDYRIERLHTFNCENELQDLVSLQSLVYNGRVFKVEGFRNWYLNNPLGHVVSFNAYYRDTLVAHYACIPYAMTIDGVKFMGLYDMATVTHPDHRGKGLFKALAQETFAYAKSCGFSFIIGVANANSFPGYMKYFPFKFVGKLDVRMVLGCNIRPNDNIRYSVYRDKELINWRLNCCKANYCRRHNSILGHYNSYVNTYMGSFSQQLLDESEILRSSWSLKPNLYVGLGAQINNISFKVPSFIKRSPFNLIFMDLTDNKLLPPITCNNVFFQLFDFDVA